MVVQSPWYIYIYTSSECIYVNSMSELARYAVMYMNLSMQVSLACLQMQCQFVERRQVIFVRDVKLSLAGRIISSDVVRGRRRFWRKRSVKSLGKSRKW